MDVDGGWPINLFLNHYICLIPDGFNFFLISADKSKVKAVKFRNWGVLFKRGLISENVPDHRNHIYLTFAQVRNFTLI